jgi:hypothetical protein
MTFSASRVTTRGLPLALAAVTTLVVLPIADGEPPGPTRRRASRP